jgi:predicted PurR-regulated permease PerM
LRTIRQLLAGEDEIQLAVRLALLALLIYWSFVVIRPFVPIRAWSVVLAVALYPVFGWTGGNLPKLAATIITLVNLAIIGPATWLGRGGGASQSCGATRRRHGGRSITAASRQGMAAHRRAILRPVGAGFDQFAPHLKPLAETMLGLAGDAGVGTANSSSRSP